MIAFRYKFADYIVRNVRERGYVEPTAIQMQAMPLMLQVGCVIAIALMIILT